MFQTSLLESLTKYSTRKNNLTLNKKYTVENRDFETPLAALAENDKAESETGVAKEFSAIKKSLLSLMIENKYQTAAAALENFVQTCPRLIEAYFLLASVYEHAGAYDKALDVIYVARYLASNDQRILRKQLSIENKALNQKTVPSLLKVKSYSNNCSFFDLCAARNPQQLDERIKDTMQRRMSLDFLLLSRFSENVELNDVAQFYANEQENENMHNTECGTLLQEMEPKYYQLEDVFPFRCKATRPIPAGTIVISDSCFALAPLIDSDNPTLFPTCFHCLRERPIPDRAIACPRFPRTCPFVFCSKECVLRNVNVHHQECAMITSVVFPLAKETGFSAGFVLLVLRSLIRAFIEHSLRENYVNEGLKFFFRLHSFTSDYEKQRPWIWNAIKILTRGLTSFLPQEFYLHLSEADLQQFIAVIHSHAIPITYEAPAAVFQHSAPTASLGLAICPNVSSIGHSCIPSCCYAYTSTGRVVVRALVDIPANGLLTISYIEDLYLPTSKRKHLESSWKVVTCNCRRCREISEGFRFLRGQRCIKCIRGLRNPLPGPILKELLQSQSLSVKANEASMLKRLPESYKENVNPEVSLPISEVLIDHSQPKLESDSASLRDNEYDKGSWICDHCGLLTPLEAMKCDSLEIELTTQLNEARELYSEGKYIQSRNKLHNMVGEYGALVHPNHFVFYNAHVLLAGLWSRGSGKNTSKALLYLRRALIVAHTVLPKFHPEKYHLYCLYSEITYSVAVACKYKGRGLGLPGTSNPGFAGISANSSAQDDLAQFLPIEAVWCAIVNAWFTRGPGSAQWISALYRLRLFARALNIHTPPLLYAPKLLNLERTISAVRDLLSNPALTPQEITKMVNEDHHIIIFMACARGEVASLLTLAATDSASRRELETPNLMTGLTALGLAASAGQVAVVRALLEKMDADMYATNEWCMTPLLAMANKPLDVLKDHTSQHMRKKEDTAQAKICAIMTKHAEELEKLRIEQMKEMQLPLRKPSSPQDLELTPTNFPFMRARLLEARSHSALGSNTACHYAAVRGKLMLTSQLLRSGTNPNIRNLEYATPLHMASVAGHADVINELIRRGALVNATNYRGETALMMATYGLHVEAVERLLKTKSQHINVYKAAKLSGATFLHCLVLGIVRTHRTVYLSSDRWKDDSGLIGSLCGFNPLSHGTSYESTSGFMKKPPITYLSMPVNESEGLSFFIFPDDLLKRLEKANDLLALFKPFLTNELLEKRIIPSGYTAAELLKEGVDDIFEQHQEAWSQSNLKLAALSCAQRLKATENWQTVFSNIAYLIEEIAPLAKNEAETETDIKTSNLLSPDSDEKPYSSNDHKFRRRQAASQQPLQKSEAVNGWNDQLRKKSTEEQLSHGSKASMLKQTSTADTNASRNSFVDINATKPANTNMLARSAPSSVNVPLIKKKTPPSKKNIVIKKNDAFQKI